VAAPAGAAIERLAGLPAIDPRVRLVDVGVAPRLPLDADAARSAWTGRLLDAGLDAATGAWVAPLGPEAEFEPDHIEVLLGVAIEHELEFVYGQALIDLGADGRLALGAWPPNPDGVLTGGSELFSTRLAAVARFDPESWRDAVSPGWAFWRSLLEAGVRIAGLDTTVTRLTLLAPGGGATGGGAAA
jgi:hypothetical protein